MVLRLSLALLVILGTYLWAAMVERTFSPHVVGSGSTPHFWSPIPGGR
jgi:hypothetical protein